MFKHFISNIENHQLFNQEHNLLLAISGGVDSVVLAYLLKKGGFNFSLAHCNFGLRDTESDADENFCKKLAQQLGSVIYTQAFDVKTYSKKKALSTQMAARELRYKWFDELKTEHNFDCILTAHHANDALETLFLNLIRGTGINGLKGMEEKKNSLVRPLLCFNKLDIKAYATKNKITFRLDKSNFEDTYERNFLRLNILPLFNKMKPGFEQMMVGNMKRFAQENEIVQHYLAQRTKGIPAQEGGIIKIPKSLVLLEPFSETLIHYLLSPYGFNTTQQKDILQSIKSSQISGKRFISKTYRLLIDRNELLIKKLEQKKYRTVIIKSIEDLKHSSFFKIKYTNTFCVPNKTELLIQKDRLQFPITLRAWKKGDKFMPFGMKHFKLLSDFFKDQKLNHFDKEQCIILENGNNEIIWLLGYRSDERYRVLNTQKKLLHITALEQA